MRWYRAGVCSAEKLEKKPEKPSVQSIELHEPFTEARSMLIACFSMALIAVEGVGCPQVRRLTAATLPAAETAPTARLDWRRALRNILREVSGDRRRKESNCNDVQLGEGRFEAGDAAFAESKLGRFCREESDKHSKDSNGEQRLRDKCGGGAVLTNHLAVRGFALEIPIPSELVSAGSWPKQFPATL